MKKPVIDFKNIKQYMTHFRFFLISIFTLLITTFYIFEKKNYKIKYLFGEKDPLVCDSTIVPKFSVLDVATTLNKNPILNIEGKKIILFATDTSGEEYLFTYNRLTNQFQEIGNSSALNNSLTAPDSIAFKALISPNPKLYEQWWSLIKPHREVFWIKRNQLFDELSVETPKYNYKVVSDFRLSDNQAKLLETGRSATPLSQHQFGLAMDVAIKKTKTYLKGFNTYKVMGDRAIEKGMFWGGYFKGFIDAGHIQFFENSANMLSKLPELRFEFEPYRQYYFDRVVNMTKEGKADSIEDTQELLQILETLNEGKLCKCEQNMDSLFTQELSNNHKLLQADYQPNMDFLVDINSKSKYIKIIAPNGKSIKHRIGTWN